jgi:hypothetical protein
MMPASRARLGARFAKPTPSIGPMTATCGVVTGLARRAADSSVVLRILSGLLAICLGVALAALPTLARTEIDATDDALRIYAVHVVSHPEPPWPLYGIYLGRGLVITAAHVVDRWKPTWVRFADQELPAKILKPGAFEKEDLTLLSVDAQLLPIKLRLRRMPLCQVSPWPGEPVVVAIPEGTARSQILTPYALPRDVRSRFPTVIKDVATTGNSGSGVFDVGHKCLLGIMSRKIQVRSNPFDAKSELKDLAKYFVPAKMIADFIPSEYRF